MFNIENILNIKIDKVHSNEGKTRQTLVDKSIDVEEITVKKGSASAKRLREINGEEEDVNLKKLKQNNRFDVVPSFSKELPKKVRNYIVNKFEKPHQCDVESCNLKEYHKKIIENNEQIIAEKDKHSQNVGPQSQLKKRPRENSEYCGDTTSKKMKYTHEFDAVACSSKYWPQQGNKGNENLIKPVNPTYHRYMKQTNLMKRLREESDDEDKNGNGKRAKENIDVDDVIIVDEDEPNVTSPNSEIIVSVVNNKIAIPNTPTYVTSEAVREMLQQHYIINNQQMIFKMTEPELFASRYNEQMEIAHVRDIHKYPNIEMSFRRLQHLYNTHPRYALENIHKIEIPPLTLGHVDLSAYPSAYRSPENISANVSTEIPTPVTSFNIDSLLNLPKD